ncbi:MAG: hypothetical protein KIB53_01955 [Paraclostridium bifermentans]|uniref:hypothetical protein n=1 Tax=Paraclostridium bifermentans TaxID=1490 RepID=UPI00241D1971|nr:hypothetical protein [Paraclostridium bifermentans]MBS5952554.1 hypothetical protein [Paraclostridium bifermentans]
MAIAVGCKNGCLCNDINKELCCIECENFETCKGYCFVIDSVEGDILFNCKRAFEYTIK